MSEQNKAVVRRLVEVHWNEKKPELVSELFAPDVSIDTPDGTLAGLDGASFLLQAYTTAFPDFRLDIEDLLADGDQVVFRWTFSGTNLGPFGQIPASGRGVSVPRGIGIFHLAGGKVDRGYLAWDKFALLQQIGVLPADPAGDARVA